MHKPSEFVARLRPRRNPPGRGRVSDRIVDDLQDRGCGGAHCLSVSGTHYHRQLLPQPAGGRQIQLHHPPRGNPLLGGTPAEHLNGVQLAPLRPASMHSRTGQ
jgi:hypothetical protein